MRALRPGERTALVLVASFVIAATIAVAFPYVTSPPTRPSPDPVGVQATPFIFPGKVRPPTVPAAAAGLPDDEPVIGVTAKRTPRAYVRKAFAGMPNHVVNDVVGDTPVTVTHFNGCTRVYTGPGTEPLRIMTGGLADGLLLCVDGGFYDQATGQAFKRPDAGPLPYELFGFEEMTWAKWRAAHSDTDVYLGAPTVRPTRPKEKE